MNFTLKITLPILLLTFNSICFSQSFKITTDTISVSVSQLILPAKEVQLTHVVKYQGNYLTFFDEVNKKDQSRSNLKFCFIIDNSGRILKNIALPQKIKSEIYYDLFLRHDSTFVKLYMNQETYFFDKKNSQWAETNEAKDIIFEDKRFYFTFLSFGEWGSRMWCIDKKTNKEYELASYGIINKIGNIYYITEALRVLKLADPLKLQPCKKEHFYRRYRNTQIFREGTLSLKGVEIIYKDSAYSKRGVKPKFYISTSFLSNNKLYYLCLDSTNTFIGTLKNGEMFNLQSLNRKLPAYNWYYSYRDKILEDNSQLLIFKDNTDVGLLEIKGEALNIRYLNLK